MKKHISRVLLVGLAALPLVGGGLSADAATTATTLTLDGSISIGLGLPSSAPLSMSGVCVDATAGSQPIVRAEACNARGTGTVSGYCHTWAGFAKVDVIATSSVPAVNPRNYSLSLYIESNAGLLVMQGTATDVAGAVRKVTGVGTVSGGELAHACTATAPHNSHFTATLAVSD